MMEDRKYPWWERLLWLGAGFAFGYFVIRPIVEYFIK